MVKVQLVKSLIHEKKRIKDTAHSLGLFHIGDSVEVSEAQQPKILVLNHLIKHLGEEK